MKREKIWAAMTRSSQGRRGFYRYLARLRPESLRGRVGTFALMGTLVTAFFCAGSSAHASPGPPPLRVGSPAPSLTVDDWIIGDELAAFEPGTVYVVEMWATWCGPCHDAIPKLLDLQARYRGQVQILSISHEAADKVADFVGARGGYTYPVGADPDRSVYTAYLDSMGLAGIPQAFVIGPTGRLEWVGAPTQMEPVLASLVAGDFDGERYLDWRNENYRLRRSLDYQERAGKWDTALELTDSLIAHYDEVDDPELYGTARPHQLRKLGLLAKSGRSTAAALYCRSLTEEHWFDSEVLLAIAGVIAETDPVSQQASAEALEAGLRATILSNGNSQAYTLLAALYFDLGELGLALEWQTRAIRSMSGDEPGFQAASVAMRGYIDAAEDDPRTRDLASYIGSAKSALGR